MSKRVNLAASTSTFAAGFFALALGLIGYAQASERADLAVVKPVIDCAALVAKAPLNHAARADVTAQAALIETAEGQFCRVTGNIAPTIGFEVDLPTTKWTQRFYQGGCGGLCGAINASIRNAGDCQPALDGEFVVAASDLGHKGKNDDGSFAVDPQKRIDYAYRANHVTALVAKALIHTFYGQQPRFSYFSGCSSGGKEALMEAERFPDDFNGVSAGAPGMLPQMQAGLVEPWDLAVNVRADGSHILLTDKLPVLHSAAIAHCDALDGVTDGVLSDPRACKVDPSWVRCAASATDTSQCLTEEEWTVAAKLYSGPVDAAGRHFVPGGLQPGSELGWTVFLPREAAPQKSVAEAIAGISKVAFPEGEPSGADGNSYPFTDDEARHATVLHPLNDATNTDLRPFARRGGKAIVWHGWSDPLLSPLTTITYVKAVQKEMGAMATEKFLRLFLIPGVAHCGGGDGFSQIDTMNELVAWVEKGVAPTQIIASRVPQTRDGQRGQRGPEPYARADVAPLASRPIYPFPQIAHLIGNGDPALATSYQAGPSPVVETSTPSYADALFARDFQKLYEVKDGKLIAAGH